VRFTIERLRTLVLVAGVLLIVALGVFLGLNRWKNKFIRHDLPQRLGIDIQEEANGWTYSHQERGHTLFKIHASKLVQLNVKQGNNVFLHDVTIELYGEDGGRTDRIEGNEFEYNPKAGIAKATGPVEITVTRPGAVPANAPKGTASQVSGEKQMNSALAAAAQTATHGEIHVKTSGLTFDRNSGEATTDQRVEFEMTQGQGSAMGAAYDAHAGRLVLASAVELTTQRGGEPVTLHAQHAEFERGDQMCALRAATVRYRNGESRAEEANVYFRDDGSAVRLEASDGFSMATANGGRLAAPTGVLDFDEHNQPRHGHLNGGVSIDSENNGRQVHGTAPTAEMEFAGDGELRSVHMERGVQIFSDEHTYAEGEPVRTQRSWDSPVVDVAFRNGGNRRVELASIHGTGGVVVNADSHRGNGPDSPSRMTADDVTGEFGPDEELTAMTGLGHASIRQTTPAGVKQTTSGDKLVAHFAVGGKTAKGNGHGTKDSSGGGMQIESAIVDGNVVLVQEPAARSGAAAQGSLRATAGRAIYEGAGEWLHLAQSPRVTDGGLALAADKIDVSQVSGDAFAHGNVKATWLDPGSKRGEQQKDSAGQGGATLGAQGPAHAIAAEAQLHRDMGEATFQGKARLWQQANSITAPVIVLDRKRQTLTARSTNAAEPVQVVLVSAAAAVLPGKQAMVKQTAGKPEAPSVVRVRGGDLKYSSAERKAVMHGGAAGSVVASTSDANTTSNELELILLPPGNHAGKDGEAAQVDRMTSRGHVVVASGGRRGTGEQLVYSSETGNYVLTGTAEAPPRLTDPTRGTVTGEALIFNSRDDSVSIEGGGRKTTTVTTAPK
jgi:lipopolysaccharide export system protein LptA